MELSLQKLDAPIDREGPLLLVIADGFGCADYEPSNAIAMAETPNIDALLVDSIELKAHGPAVGLPTEGDMGCLLYTSPSPRDRQKSRMPSSA